MFVCVSTECLPDMPLAAAMERMYADQSMRKQMGQAGRERIGTRFRNGAAG